MDATKDEILKRAHEIVTEINAHKKGRNSNGVVPDHIHEAAIQSLCEQYKLLYELLDQIESRNALSAQIRNLEQKKELAEQKIKELLNKIEQLKVPSAG